MLFHGAAQAQFFLTGLGGSAAVTNTAAASATPLPSASNYDAKLGRAASISPGYHINDWFSVQGVYIWNRNRITVSELSGGILRVSETMETQHALGADLMVYFRPRSSFLRPYLSAGPAIVHSLNQNRPGLRVAVGADLKLGKKGWGVRYTFSEMMSSNPYGMALHPPSAGRLMNFQNLVGVTKTF